MVQPLCVYKYVFTLQINLDQHSIALALVVAGGAILVVVALVIRLKMNYYFFTRKFSLPTGGFFLAPVEG